MQFIILSLLVCIHTVLAESNATKTYMLHLRWLPTHCLNRYCTVSENITMDISKLRASPHFNWVDFACPSGLHFFEQDIYRIPDLNTYWTNPTDELLAHYWVYYDYGACTVMDESGTTPILYFNHSINLYKQLMTPNNVENLHSILEKKVHSTAKVEGELLKTFGVQPKLICAESEVGSVYLHEVVFCFNEASSLVNCPSEYASQLEEFNPDDYVKDERLLRGEIKFQILCPAEFIIPDYKIVRNAKVDTHTIHIDSNGNDHVDDYYDDNDDEDGDDEDGDDEDDDHEDGYHEDDDEDYHY
uniref:Uncharacterized protein n=1 Tax=Trichobilharzia regenti TaxID=157069 RepID=A0AA85K3P2_TRIRE|nr:unnamed protein product [Trichobilharzia regenti]